MEKARLSWLVAASLIASLLTGCALALDQELPEVSVSEPAATEPAATGPSAVESARTAKPNSSWTDVAPKQLDAMPEETSETDASPEDPPGESAEAEPNENPKPSAEPPTEKPKAATEAKATAETKPTEDIKTATPATAKPEMSDELKYCAFELDGAHYILPAPYAQFKQNGWSGNSRQLQEKLAAGEITDYVLISKGSHSVHVGLTNPGKSAAAVEDCVVWWIGVIEGVTDSGTSFALLPDGITLGTAKEELLLAYGEPTAEELIEMGTQYEYRDPGSSAEAVIVLSDETDKVIGISLGNYTADASSDEVSETPPTELAEYQAPSSLGDNWSSFNFKYAGDYYHIPAPVTEFLKNGWIVKTDTNQMVDAREILNFEMSKDGETLITFAENYADSPQPLSDCFVAHIGSNYSSNKFELELPKGLTLNSTVKEFIDAYGSAASSDPDGNMAIYVFGEVNRGIMVYEDQNTKEISEIMVVYVSERQG